MNFLAGIFSSLVDKYVMRLFGYFKKLFISKKIIDKESEKIDADLEEVLRTIKVIKTKKAGGQELTKEDVKALQIANRKLSAGFFK